MSPSASPAVSGLPAYAEGGSQAPTALHLSRFARAAVTRRRCTDMLPHCATSVVAATYMSSSPLGLTAMPWTSPLTTAVALLGGVAMGAIYAAHLGFAEDIKIYIIEEHSTREYRGLAPTSTPLQLLVSAHAHAAVALWAAAVMFIGLRWSRMWEWKPRLYRWALVFQIIGVVVTLFGTAVVPVWRPIAHQIIFGGIGPLHITLLFLWLRLGAMLKGGGWRDPVKLGLFLVPIWMVVFVTSTGPMLASQIKTLRAVWPLEDEITYNVAHWHMLAFVAASAMFLLYLTEFCNRAKYVSGWLLAVGGTVALAGAFVYQLSPMFVKGDVDLAAASSGLKKAVLPVLDVGLAMSFTSFALFTLWLFYKHLTSGKTSQNP